MPIPQPVAVFGATGSQGSSVMKALLAAGASVVAITRNPSGSKGKQLKRLGADVRGADLDDPASLRAALEGCGSIYLVTDYWGLLGSGLSADEARDREIQQVRHVVDAAKTLGSVRHIVYSSLEDCEALAGISVPHFDGKGRAAMFLASSGIPFTLVQLAFYMENLAGLIPPQRGADGKLVLALPMKDKPLEMFCVDDVGKVVTTILSNPGAHAGKTYGLAGARIPVAKIAADLGAAVGEHITYKPVSAKEYAKLGFPGAEDLANMFSFLADHPDKCKRSISETTKLVGGEDNLTTFDKWLSNNRNKLKF